MTPPLQPPGVTSSSCTHHHVRARDAASVDVHLPSIVQSKGQRDRLWGGCDGGLATFRVAVKIVDLNRRGLPSGHCANGFADDRKKAFASKLALKRFDRVNLIAVTVL